MERPMTVEERIRRAEGIYNRRNGISANNNVKEKKGVHIKKLFMQIFIVLIIYTVFYAVSNKEYVFSEQFRNEFSAFFTEKTEISKWYMSIKSYINEKIGIFGNDETKENANQDNSENMNNIENNNQNEVTTNIENTTQNEESIGGAVEEEKIEENNVKSDENISETLETEKNSEGNIEIEKNDVSTEISKEEKKEISEQEQMEKDAEEIKAKISFIKPIEGRISSTFGWRNPTTDTVPKYHTGTDIAANEGTIIKSATDGKVIMASSYGDYGNHYQIQIEDVVIVYAHCKKLYLKEGDEVKQGQEIAEVGSTGNSTGPHLHFEVRKDERKIDPQLILNL